MSKKILFSLSLLAAFVLVFCFYFIVPQQEFQLDPDDIIYRGNTVQVRVTPCPLQKNTLSVESNSEENNLTLWTPDQHAESFNLLENIATLWREQAFIDDFLVIGVIPPRMHAEHFFWEIIPYPKTNFNFWDQFLVVWRLTFNAPYLSKNEKRVIKNKYLESTSFFSHAYSYIPERTCCSKTDVFCNPAIIAKQLVYEGKLINLLYNNSPIGIGDEKLHFLLIPKAHRTSFPELTLEEYKEAQFIASKLITFYSKRNFPIVYLFHKTGKLAGQTVPHWHEHVIFAPSKNNEFWGKLWVLRRMLIPASPLSDETLQTLVNKYRQEVKEAMK